MGTFFVETYRPPHPEQGIKHRVHRDKDYGTDVLHPCVTTVFEVNGVRTKQDAVAAVIEHAAGIPVTVRCILGKR